MTRGDRARARLSGARLSGARLSGARLSGARLSGALGVTGLAVALTLSACSSASQASNDTSEPAVGTIARVVSSDALALPIDQYIPSRGQLAQVQAAYRARLRQCVARFGRDYATPIAPATPASSAGPNARRYGVTDAELVAVYGYRPPPELTAPRAPQQPIPADVETILSGKGPSTINGKPVPRGGCTAEATADVNGGTAPTEDDNLAERLSLESFSRSAADTRVRAVLVKWSTCMKDKGFDYATPDNAISDPRFGTGAAASKLEISTAKADVACKAQVNLVGVWSTVEAAYQQRLIETQHSTLEATRKSQADRVKRAAAVLGSPS